MAVCAFAALGLNAPMGPAVRQQNSMSGRLAISMVASSTDPAAPVLRDADLRLGMDRMLVPSQRFEAERPLNVCG